MREGKIEPATGLSKRKNNTARLVYLRVWTCVIPFLCYPRNYYQCEVGQQTHVTVRFSHCMQFIIGFKINNFVWQNKIVGVISKLNSWRAPPPICPRKSGNNWRQRWLDQYSCLRTFGSQWAVELFKMDFMVGLVLKLHHNRYCFSCMSHLSWTDCVYACACTTDNQVLGPWRILSNIKEHY